MPPANPAAAAVALPPATELASDLFRQGLLAGPWAPWSRLR